MNRYIIILFTLFASQSIAHQSEEQEMDAFDVASTLMSRGVGGDCFNPSLLRELSLKSGQSFINPELSEQEYTRCVERFARVIEIHGLPLSLRELIKWK